MHSHLRRVFEWLNLDRFREAEWCFLRILAAIRSPDASLENLSGREEWQWGSLGAVHVAKYGSLDRQDPFLSGAGIADSLSVAPPFSLFVAIFESWGYQRHMREPRF